jgi:hypothetical protein
MTAIRLSWVPLDCDDDELDALDDEAEGFFCRVLKRLGRCGGQLPADIAKLARALHRDPRKVRRLWAKVEHRFIVAGGSIRHRGVNEAIERLEKTRLRPDFRQKCRSNPRETNEPSDYRDKEESPIKGDPSMTAHGAETEPPPRSENTRANSARQKRRKRQAPDSVIAKRARRRRRNTPRKTPITSWTLGPADIAFAQQRGFNDDLRLRQVAEEFLNRKLDEGWLSADWSAAWRRWVIGAARIAAERAAAAARHQPTSMVAAMRTVRAFREARASFG